MVLGDPGFEADLGRLWLFAELSALGIDGDRANVNGVCALWSLYHAERYWLACLEGFITVYLDCRKMCEEIFVLPVLDNETVALGIVEPFDLSLDSHASGT